LAGLIASAQPDGGQHAVKQLAGGTHKGLTLPIFLFAWGLAHHHPLGLGMAHAEHGMAAGLA
jgi:hypothetical protein